MTNTEFKELQKENKVLRKELDDLIGLDSPIYSPIWVTIGNLIDNEIEQEKFCNQ